MMMMDEANLSCVILVIVTSFIMYCVSKNHYIFMISRVNDRNELKEFSLFNLKTVFVKSC